MPTCRVGLFETAPFWNVSVLWISSLAHCLHPLLDTRVCLRGCASCIHLHSQSSTMADLEDNFISDMHTVTDDDSSETESTIQSSLYSGASAAPEEMCCGKPEKQLRVIIIIVASLVMIVAALAAALGVALTKPDCAKGYCNAYHTNYSVVRSMPGQAPSFLRFSQTSHEVSTCSAPRAFVVGGIGTLGWAQRWALSTQEDASHLFDSATDLVLNTSGSLNWPHSVVQDPCTGSIYIANANDDRIDTLSCASSTVDTSNFQVSCDTYNPMASFTSAFFNPLGLHEVSKSCTYRNLCEKCFCFNLCIFLALADRSIR